MPKIKWDEVGKRIFENGLDHGVVYPSNGTPVPWNGLLSVSQKPINGQLESLYFDGYRQQNNASFRELDFSIEAYTYPPELDDLTGGAHDLNGLGYSNQNPIPFGLVYRTLIGNDVSDTKHGYKIHVIYNCLALPTGSTYDTNSATSNASTFMWDVSTTPLFVKNTRQPTAYYVFDSTRIKPQIMRKINEIIFGTAYSVPRLPKASEIANSFM